ncbi:hypothetical protein HZC30_05805 [Candidatus Woesearchaeota archaeon]|nr:hypothetical protein [Candidatus Woesearchaeota archaeon]
MNEPDVDGKAMRYVRYYVLITTVIILLQVGIFLWFTERENIKGIIGASVSTGDIESVTGSVLTPEITSTPKDDSDDEGAVTAGKKSIADVNGETSVNEEISVNEETSITKVISSSKKLTEGIKSGTWLETSFNTIPAISSTAKFAVLNVRFIKANTKLMVNKQTLELGSLEQVELKIDDFGGNLNFNSRSLSLEGTAARISVNGIALSGKELELSFQGLEYEQIKALGIELPKVELSNGKGNLILGRGKLRYELESKDKAALRVFEGDLTVDKSKSAPVSMEGIISGVEVSGRVDMVLG